MPLNNPMNIPFLFINKIRCPLLDTKSKISWSLIQHPGTRICLPLSSPF